MNGKLTIDNTEYADYGSYYVLYKNIKLKKQNSMKIHYNSLKLLNTDQTRPDQTRPDLICKEYIYTNNNNLIIIINKLQPMLQSYTAS